MSVIRVTGKASNTAAEAVEVGKLLDRHASILLVTSAFHIPRSRQLFEAEGFKVLPYAVDFRVDAVREFSGLDLVPSAVSFAQTEKAWREWLGRFYCRLRGLTNG